MEGEMRSTLISTFLQKCSSICCRGKPYPVSDTDARIEEYPIRAIVYNADFVCATLLFNGACSCQRKKVPIFN